MSNNKYPLSRKVLAASLQYRMIAAVSKTSKQLSHFQYIYRDLENNINGGIHLTSVHTIYRLKCRVYKILQTLHIVVTPVK